MATLVAQVKGSQKGQLKSGRNKESKRSLDQPIPQKTDVKASGNKQEATKSTSSEKQKKRCEKVAKLSPKLKHYGSLDTKLGIRR